MKKTGIMQQQRFFALKERAKDLGLKLRQEKGKFFLEKETFNTLGELENFLNKKGEKYEYKKNFL